MSAAPQHIALVSEVASVPWSQVTRVSAALQRQVSHDLAPIWHIQATVSAFAKLEDVPSGYWPILVDEQVEGAGIHLDKDGHPLALVEAGPAWSLAASHECLEMLANPLGNRLMRGLSPKPGQGEVEFLVEICDPCEAPRLAYSIDGVLVSDFFTPSFLDEQKAPGVRYSCRGQLVAPRTVLPGGYLSFRDPASNHWYQQTFFEGTQPEYRDLGVFTLQGGSFRALIEGRTPERKHRLHVPAGEPRWAERISPRDDEEGNPKAAAWRAQIQALKQAPRRSARAQGERAVVHPRG